MSSGDGCPIDGVNGLLEDDVEIVVALAGAQILREGAGEAGDEAVVAREFFVCIVHRVAAAEGNDADDVRVFHNLRIEVVDGRDGDLEHDLCVCGQSRQMFLHAAEHDLLCLCLVGAVDVNLGFEDGDESLADDLHADLELLVDDGADAVRIRLLDNGAHLRAKDMALVCAVEQFVEIGDRLHELDAALLLRKPLVDLQDGDDALLIPEEICDKEAVDLVDAREHLLVAVVGALVDAVRLERLWRGAAALVERRDEALVMRHASELFLIHWTYLLLK